MTNEAPPEGWYPSDEHLERFWDGQAWTGQTRPRVPATAVVNSEPAPAAAGSTQLVTALIVAAAVVGFIMAIQGASLLTGTGNLWTGVAIAVAATVVAFITKSKTWVKVLVVLAALAALANTISVEIQLDDLRSEFGTHSPIIDQLN